MAPRPCEVWAAHLAEAEVAGDRGRAPPPSRGRRVNHARRARRLALACLLVPLGCGPSAEQREARQLLADLDRLRDADDPQRGPLLEQLERTSATGVDAELARKDCTAAYRALDQSAALEASVRVRLGSLAPGAGRPAETGTPPDAGTPAKTGTPPDAGPDAGAPPPSLTSSDAPPSPPDSRRLVDDLAEAERQLDRARELMPRCEKSLAVLRQRARGAAAK